MTEQGWLHGASVLTESSTLLKTRLHGAGCSIAVSCLRQALAAEAGVPFIYTSGSSFSLPIAGLGVMHVRRLFEQARSHNASIIFIDEFDSLARKRLSYSGGARAGRQSRRRTMHSGKRHSFGLPMSVPAFLWRLLCTCDTSIG
jgi:hypothetical protein